MLRLVRISFFYRCLFRISDRNAHRSSRTNCIVFAGDFIRNLVALESGGSGGVVWRIRASDTKLVCAVGSRNGTEETKLLVLDFDVEVK